MKLSAHKFAQEITVSDKTQSQLAVPTDSVHSHKRVGYVPKFKQL